MTNADAAAAEPKHALNVDHDGIYRSALVGAAGVV